MEKNVLLAGDQKDITHPITLAVRSNDVKKLHGIIEVDEDSVKALEVSCIWGKGLITRYLVEVREVDVNANKGQALINSSHNGHIKMTQYLIDHGADPEVQNNRPLMRAARAARGWVIKTLIKAGVDPQAEDNQAVIEACEHGTAFRTLKILINNGADITIQDNKALNISVSKAAQANQETVALYTLMVRILLENGADPSQITDDVLELVRQTKHPKLVEQLSKFGLQV